jgi:hypothetical protein
MRPVKERISNIAPIQRPEAETTLAERPKEMAAAETALRGWMGMGSR